jgi:hypothetical protein
MQQLVEKIDEQLRLNFHPGQLRAWDSQKRFIFILSGTQSGKTEFAVHWLYREILNCGDGDYIVASPSFPLQQKKVLPAYLDIFDTTLKLGEYKISDRIFYANRKGLNSKIFFGSADKPDSLESATAKAAHIDEVGQKSFRLSSWEAILRRLSIHQGRVLGTTTLYNLGWLKNEVYERWEKGDLDYDVIQFDSIMNPAFPKAEFERARDTLPAWKFNMAYRGRYDRPAGLIYDSFDDKTCKVAPIPLDPIWPRHVGIDFGGVHTAVLWFAEHKINELITNYYLYREYLEGGKTSGQHCKDILDLSKNENVVNWVGGSKSEGQWRQEWQAGGIPVKEPKISDVEVGIDRVYGLHSDNRVFVFNTCKRFLDEIGSYSRMLDEKGLPTEEIEDKHSFHMMDAKRYILGYLAEPYKSFTIVGVDREPEVKKSLWA